MRISSQLFIVLAVGALAGAAAGFAIYRVAPPFSVLPASFPIAAPRPARPDAALKTEDLQSSLLSIVRPKLGATLISRADALASGVALTKDGLILVPETFKNTARLVAISSDRRTFTLALPDTSKSNFTIGALKMSALKTASREGRDPSLKPVSFFPFEELYLGQRAVSFDAAGRFAQYRVVERSVRAPYGVISSDEVLPMIRLDAALGPGLFVFDAQDGRLIGLSSAGGLLLPAEVIETFARQYLKQGEYAPARLGVHFLDLNALTPLTDDLPSFGGLIAGDEGQPAIVAKSPAARAGLREGDTIRAFDGRRLEGTLPLELLIQRYAPGTEVELEILRAGEVEKVKARIE